jgi:uncharacterized protein (DUF1778 family)
MATELERSSTRDATINLRLQSSARDLIDQAAAAQGKTRTEFMVDASRRAAEAVLLDRCLFTLSDKDFARLHAALDKPPANNPRLRRLLREAAPWESNRRGS